MIGVLGDDPVTADLGRMLPQQKPVQGRPIRVLHARTVAELAGCHILFISGSEQSRLDQALAALAHAGGNVLTVGESEGFLEAGGAIRFVLEDGKVRFDINAHAAHRAGLMISSKLLSLARNIRERSSMDDVRPHAPLLAWAR